uniref:Uncharacterized protein n=1 Tax=Solanum lycopersicum TaxID=4081 RepID=K4B7X1_SOLLC
MNKKQKHQMSGIFLLLTFVPRNQGTWIAYKY